MKGKGVVTAEDSDEKGDSSFLPPGRLPTRNASSKYDFVKVKVWLGDNADHYYVLSRFLLSRMLTVTKIPNHVAIKIALELKKLLIDNSLLDVSQSDLEANLFKVQLSLIRFLLLAFDQDRNLFSRPGRHGFDVYINVIDRIFSIHCKLMERRGYGEEYINRYKMMTRFHHQRVPLVILVCGTACTGKSTIATQLAQRLNLPNVLQTDMVYELLRTSTDAPLASTPVWAREFNSPEELITEFCRECRIVRKGLAGDLKKAMKDGKPIIIEGIHLDPSIYLVDEENRVLTDLPRTSENTAVVSEPSEDNTATLAKHTENEKCAPEKVGAKEGTSADQVAEVTESLGSVDLAKNASDYQGRPLNDPDTKSSKSLKNQKIAAEPIIVPMVLKMAEFDHKALLEEWISKRTFWDKCLDQDQDKLISNIKTIQDYLCSFESQGLTVINNSATTFPQTLDGLHSYLLQCIERGISTKSSETGRQSGGKD